MGSKYTYMIDQLQEGRVSEKRGLHIYPEEISKAMPEIMRQ